MSPLQLGAYAMAAALGAVVALPLLGESPRVRDCEMLDVVLDRTLRAGADALLPAVPTDDPELGLRGLRDASGALSRLEASLSASETALTSADLRAAAAGAREASADLRRAAAEVAQTTAQGDREATVRATARLEAARGPFLERVDAAVRACRR